jgi:hypothetical protein
MRNLILLILFLQANSSFSQIESILLNKSTKEVIPYASIYIKNSKIGTSSDLEGKFSISLDTADTLMISSVGFNFLELPFREIEDTLEMEYDIQQMSEIIVRPKREKSGWFPKKYILGDIKSNYFSINVWLGSGGNAFQIARFFEYQPKYRITPYIQQITFNTWSKVENAIYSVKLYEVNADGLPGKLINSKTIIGNAKKRMHKSTIDIEDRGIRFPKEGLFVAIDYINIESNRSLKGTDYGFLYDDYKYEYSPSIGLKYSEKFEIYKFNYSKGKWYISEDFRAVLECEIVLVE